MILVLLYNTELGLFLGRFDAIGNYIPNLDITDPLNGPDVYSFSLNDDEKLQEYITLRDEIFEKIKADYNNH